MVGFHVNQETQREVDANKAVYAMAILNTIVDILAVTPVLVCLRAVIIPNLVKRILRVDVAVSHASLETDMVGSSRRTVATVMIGVAKAKTKFLNNTRQGLRVMDDRGESADDDMGSGVFSRETGTVHGDDAAGSCDDCSAEPGGVEDWSEHTDSASGVQYWYSQRQRRATWSNPANCRSLERPHLKSSIHTTAVGEASGNASEDDIDFDNIYRQSQPNEDREDSAEPQNNPLHSPGYERRQPSL